MKNFYITFSLLIVLQLSVFAQSGGSYGGYGSYGSGGYGSYGSGGYGSYGSGGYGSYGSGGGGSYGSGGGGGCIEGCTNASFCNYDPNATCDNGTCSGTRGCTNAQACNYNANAACDDGSCSGTAGCTNSGSCNYNSSATCDDGSCTPFVIPSVTVAYTPDTVCTGSTITFTAAPIYGGNNPSYQWVKNGNIVGTNSNIYTDGSLNTNDSVWVVMTSDTLCASAGPDTSNISYITVDSIIIPQVTINPSSANTCYGAAVTFTATPTGGGTSPTYEWIVDGSYVSVTNNPVYIDSTLNNNDGVWAVMISNALCTSPDSAASNSVIMSVDSSQVPSISIDGPDSICSGGMATYNAASNNTGNSPSYQWQINGNNVATGPSYTTSSLINGDLVSCIVTSSAQCARPTTASNSFNIDVVSTPTTPSIQQYNEDTLTSSSASGNQWYFNGNLIPNATSQIYVAQQNGNYQVISTTGDCSSDTSASFDFLATGIQNAINTDIKLYPNPASDVIYIQSGKTIITNIEIVNIMGQTIAVNTLNSNNYKLNVGELAPGNYMLVLHTNNGITNKLISIIRE